MFSLRTLTTCGATVLFALPMLAWAAESPSKKVCLMWMGKSTIATQTAKGFLDEMQAKGQGISVESQINLGKDEGPGVYDKMQASMDAVIFLRSDGAQYMAKHAPKCPGFFGGCNNPVDLGVVKALEKPSGNLTGTTYYIPAIKTLEMSLRLMPSLKTVGLLYDPKNPSGPVDLAEMKGACAKLGMTLVEGPASTKQELASVVDAIRGKVQALVIGNQALISDNSPSIATVADTTPILSLAEKPLTTKAAMGGYVADNEKLGRLLAQRVIAVVKDGKNPAETPVGLDEAPRFVFISAKAKALGITPAPELLKELSVVE